jgi:hypothetical protein
VIGLLTVAPVILYLRMGEPVTLLKIAGVIEASHIPIVVVLVLRLNHKRLPRELNPSKFTFAVTAAAGLFFALFAGIYLMELMGG